MGDIGNLACLSILVLSITSFCCGNEVLEEIIAKRVNFDKRISDLEEQDKQKEKRIFQLEKTIGILLAEINKKSSQTDLEALKVSFLNFFAKTSSRISLFFKKNEHQKIPFSRV